jgi:hypothetical protein
VWVEGDGVEVGEGMCGRRDLTCLAGVGDTGLDVAEGRRGAGRTCFARVVGDGYGCGRAGPVWLAKVGGDGCDRSGVGRKSCTCIRSCGENSQGQCWRWRV